MFSQNKMKSKNANFNDAFARIKSDVAKVHKRAEQPSGITENLIRMEDIIVGENVRTKIDEESLKGLAASIASLGQQTAISVRPDPEQKGKWIIVTGERRYRAMQSLGKTEIKAIIDNGENIRVKQLVENIQREDMNLLDIGLALKTYIQETGSTQEQVATLIGKSRRFVHRALSVVDLPDAVKELCTRNILRDATGLDLLSRLINDNPKWQQWLIDEMLALVKASEEAAKEMQEGESDAASETIDIVITRNQIIDLKAKLETKKRLRRKDHKDHADALPMTDSVPLTLANASRLSKSKQYKDLHFNGLNVRINCVFSDPENPHSTELIGFDPDPMKCAQFTTISTDNSEIGIVEYQNQLYRVPISKIMMTGIIELHKSGKPKAKKE